MPLLVTRKRAGLRVAHVYFDLPKSELACDILRCHQIPAPPREGAWRCRPFATVVCDLTLTEAELFARLNKETRYEVRRALERDGFEILRTDAPEEGEIARYWKFHADFADRRGLDRMDLEFARQLRAQGGLSISWIGSPGEAPLAAHLYAVSERRARLCYAAAAALSESPGSRALLGRANRLLHWSDLCAFRNRGLVEFDLGGVSGDPARSELAGIDRFKQSFGGMVVQEFDCERPVTLLGRLGLAVATGIARHRPPRQERDPKALLP